ncbi:MAG: hypothetical protein PHE70_07485 [Tepidanaerobacteraceae bacterium]|nr:hypothetical protein [Tepidanaerobacteraceae bacterium]
MDIIYYITFGIIVGVFVAVNVSKYLKLRTLKRRIRKAKKGEYRAIEFIKKQGFQVVDIQKEESYTLFIDDKPYEVTVKADMIVRKGSKTYVAEVKTGEKVTSPKYKDTRRQLLEYYLVYQPNGLLLIDMEEQKIRTVVYSILKYDKAIYINRLTWSAIIFVAGLIIGFLTRGG